MQTIIHSYHFDVRNAADKAAYKDLCAKLKAQKLKRFCTWGNGSHYMPDIDGRTITLETESLFDNQWNTAPIDGVSESGLRVFDWAEDYPINFNKSIKRGHYLEQTAEMREVRRNTCKCGYCGKQEPAAKGYVFCPHCLDSEYLKESDLRLTRMVPVRDTNKPRAPLTEAEKAHLLPLYRDAQINGSTARGKARIAKKRADVQREYQQTIAQAAEKRDAATWIMDNAPGLLENWIYYTHTGRHCFGWRKPLDECLLSDLLEKVSEFPFSYDIKCADGRTLSGEH